jgi:hypothetical protein
MRQLLAWGVVLSAACGGGYHAGNLPEPQTPNSALDQFLAAVKAKDNNRMAQLWGNDKGSASAVGKLPAGYVDSVVQVFQIYLRHEGYRIIDGPTPVPGSPKIVIYHVELQLRDCNRIQPFDMINTQRGGWLVRDPHIEASAATIPHCRARQGNND